MKLLDVPQLVCIKAHGGRTVNKSLFSNLNSHCQNQTTFFQIYIENIFSLLSTIRVKRSGNAKLFACDEIRNGHKYTHRIS